MAAAYKDAFGLASRMAPDDAKDITEDQIGWLKGRVQGCTDRACIASAYEERTAALTFYATHLTRNSPDTIAYMGTYEMNEEAEGHSGTLEVFQLPDGAIRFSVRAVSVPHGTVNFRSGEATGEVRLNSGVAIYANPDPQNAQCRITMTFQKMEAIISQNSTYCVGFMDVVADGTYKKTRNYVGSDLLN
jgi:hypothetical protein